MRKQMMRKIRLTFWLVMAVFLALCEVRVDGSPYATNPDPCDGAYVEPFDLAGYPVGHRPNRIEPRAVKRRPKPHRLLTKPRAAARRDKKLVAGRRPH